MALPEKALHCESGEFSDLAFEAEVQRRFS